MVTQAGIGKRALAFILDLIIINLVIITPFKSFYNNLLPDIESSSAAREYLLSNPSFTQSLTILTIIVSILVVLYFTVFNWKLLQTPGRMLISLEIKEKKLSFWAHLLSNLTFIPFFPFIILWIVDPLYLIFTKQRLMEKVAGIHVIEKIWKKAR